jgi:predicted alpha-1,2-mannosidase
MVNVLQGTSSSHFFSRGNTLPIVAMPFGMAHWSLQTVDAGPWFFSPEDRRLNGIRCTHQLSPWLSDYGYATFLPFTGDPRPESAPRSSSYRPEEMKIHPHSLSVELLRYRTLVELAPTERCASLRLTFNEASPGLCVDLPGKDASITQHDGKAFAAVHANAGGVVPGFATYYVIESDLPQQDFTIHEIPDGCVGMIRFKTASAQSIVQLRIGTSFISFEQAALNLRNEIGEASFEATRQVAEKTWNEHLGRALVEGGTAEQRRIFYSAMYRALLFPRIWHERDASGEFVHWSPYTGKLAKGVLYADHGYWDVYRAWYPWMSLLFPERLGEILQSWVNAATEGGWLPQFPCPGYRACMTGSLIDAVFGDAAAKGIKGYDMETAFAMLKKHATQPGDPDKGYGRRGIEDYLKLGYVSVEGAEQSVAETVDAAYGDFCIAQVAHALNRTEDAALFEKRSNGWQYLYDDQTRFLRGKHHDGRWLEDFDPIRWGDPYVEGSAWQHRWDVPHDPEALMKAMGGPKYFAEQLELMIAQPPNFHVGSYKSEIHEMSEMAAVPFGQYAHSNQPVHHVLYMFAVAGRSDRLQYWVRRVLIELYSVDSFAGDEDTGAMSAWFLMSSMGFYPLCPGKAEYVIGAPLFDRVTLKLGSGVTTVIEARNNSQSNCYVRDVRLNGQAVSGIYLKHADLVKGVKVEFEMGSSPRT